MGADVNAKNYASQPVHLFNNDGEMIFNYDYLTPLHKAASNGHVEVVKVLVELGADVNAKNYAFQPVHLFNTGHMIFNYDYLTPLHKASNGHVEVVKLEEW